MKIARVGVFSVKIHGETGHRPALKGIARPQASIGVNARQFQLARNLRRAFEHLSRIPRGADDGKRGGRAPPWKRRVSGSSGVLGAGASRGLVSASGGQQRSRDPGRSTRGGDAPNSENETGRDRVLVGGSWPINTCGVNTGRRMFGQPALCRPCHGFDRLM